MSDINGCSPAHCSLAAAVKTLTDRIESVETSQKRQRTRTSKMFNKLTRLQETVDSFGSSLKDLQSSLSGKNLMSISLTLLLILVNVVMLAQMLRH